jgi:hypothetical protein
MIGISLAVLLVTAQQPPPPHFVVHTAEGKPLTGRLEKLAGGWAVSVKGMDGKLVEVPAGDLIGLWRSDRPLPPWPAGPGLILVGGDRLAGTLTGGDGRAIRFVPDYSRRENPVDWSVPISTLTAVWVANPPPQTPASPADYPWAAGGDRRDVVLLRNGDVVRGTLEAFTTDPAGLRLKSGTERTTLSLSRVAAISLDPALARDRRPKGPFARIVLADGSRFTLANATADGQTITGTTSYGIAVEFALADLIALDILQGRADYLCDLKPRTAAVEPFNAITWPWTANRSVKGNPLRIGEHTFDRGLGMHPKTTLTYDLGGRYRRFESRVGLDPATGRRGSADVHVLVDGQKRFAVAGLTLGGSPQAVAIDVGGARELTLVVDYGPLGDVQDDVNWGDARLIR